MNFRIHKINNYIPRPVKFKRVVAPESDALDLDYVKEELRVTHNELDWSIQRLITLATNACETYTNRALITQTRAIFYDRFPVRDTIQLMFGPVQSITHLKTHDENGVTATFAAAEYFLTDEQQGGALTLHRDKTWPTTTLLPREGIEIQYVAGYGDTSEDIPVELTMGMINMIKWHFNEDSEGDMPSSIYDMWKGYRLVLN